MKIYYSQIPGYLEQKGFFELTVVLKIKENLYLTGGIRIWLNRQIREVPEVEYVRRKSKYSKWIINTKELTRYQCTVLGEAHALHAAITLMDKLGIPHEQLAAAHKLFVNDVLKEQERVTWKYTLPSI